MEATHYKSNSDDSKSENENEMVDKTIKVTMIFLYALLNHTLLGKIK